METWKKQDLLGKGSYGEVFLASPANPNDERVIAVKSASVQDKTRLRCLLKEAAVLEELKGEKYIVRCFGDDWSVAEYGEGFYNLLLEFAPDGNLSDLIRNPPKIPKMYQIQKSPQKMCQTRVAYFTKMLLIGLSGIHAKGIAHCDLKPANILVFPTCGHQKLKIADFGLARRVSDVEVPEIREGKYWNKGTTLYASPESITRGEHGTPADVWALGITVAEMMTGNYFWDLQQDLYDQIVGEPLDLDNRIPGRFDDDATDFLDKCLDRDPSKRWTAQDLLKHPFITDNLNGRSRYSFAGADHPMEVENPIDHGSNTWVSTCNLFAVC